MLLVFTLTPNMWSVGFGWGDDAAWAADEHRFGRLHAFDFAVDAVDVDAGRDVAADVQGGAAHVEDTVDAKDDRDAFRRHADGGHAACLRSKAEHNGCYSWSGRQRSRRHL